MNKNFYKTMARMLVATVVAGCVAFSLTKFIPLRITDVSLVITIPRFLLIASGSVVAYLIASYFLNLEEVKPIFDYIKKILFKNAK